MKNQVFALLALTALSGCVQPAQSARSAYGSENVVASQTMQTLPQQAVPMQQAMVPQQGMMSDYQNNNAATMMLFSKTLSELDAMRDRLHRTEKAMVRLDRRMQLLERNELTRMSDEPAVQPAPASSYAPAPQQFQQPAGGYRQMSPLSFQNGTAAPAQPVALNSGRGAQAAQPVSAGIQQAAALPRHFQNVAFNGQGQNSIAAPVRAVLTPAAPRQPQVDSVVPVARTTSTLGGLPSLADRGQGQGQTMSEASVSVWTVNYQDGKVWPSRDQLLAARDVVEALSAGQPVALFARGVNPSSREFRDRVKALSRYLGQVANLDSVPIASMSAQHLDADTIEVLATK